METEWGKLLQRTKANDLVAGQKLLCIDANHTINDCLQLLKENNISACPVVDNKQNNKAIGFVDVLDICAYALHLWRTFCHSENAKFTEMINSRKFFDTNIRELINFSGRDSFLHLPVTASLLDCFNCFYDNQFKSHRLILMNENGQAMKLISMLDLINFANQHINLIAFSDSKINEAKLLKACIMIRHDSMLANALSVLCDNGISGLALVDLESKLVANFSASDLKGALPEVFNFFWKPTVDYLRNSSVKSKLPPRAFDMKANLRDIIKTMSDDKIHRVFLTDEMQRPIGVVSCTDLIECLSPRGTSELIGSQ